MRKALFFILACFVSFATFAQHVEYYPNSQRYYMELYNKPEMNWSDSCNDAYPLSWNWIQMWPIHYENDLYHNCNRFAHECHVSNMDGRAIYGIVVLCNILQLIGQYDVNYESRYSHNCLDIHAEPYYPLSFDSVSSETNAIIDSTWKKLIDTLQHRSEVDRFKMWLLRPTGQGSNQSCLIDSVYALPEWNMITDSKFVFPNMWLDDSVHPFFGHAPYITFPTLEVYFEQPYIVNDSFFVGTDNFPVNTIFEYYDTILTFPQVLNLRCPGCDFPHLIRIKDCSAFDYYYQQSHVRDVWNGVFPILVPPSGCYKPGVLRASVIGYDSAVVEWMSRFWLPESRVEYGPAGFAPDSGTVIYGVTGNKITLHGLSEDTEYEVRVSNWCSDDSAYSEQSVTSFRTAPRCEPAGEESLFVATDTTIQLAWEMPDSASWCEVEWGPEGFVEGEGTLLPHVNPGYMGGYLFLQHLQPATSYDVRVRNWCPHSQAFSQWREYNVATKGRYTISVASNNDNWGHVTGAGVYLEGERAMLNAIPASEVCHFSKWLDGDISNPRFVEVSADSLFTAIFINDTMPLSVSAPSSPHSLTLRPNPTSGMVEISARESLSSIDLYDISGRHVLHFEPLSSSASLDLSLLAPGLYTLRATTQGGIVYTEKLLVKRQ